MNYEEEVKKVYPKPYEAYNNLFETWCLYEDHTMTNRLSERCKRGYEIWQSAYNSIYPLHLSRITNTTCYIQFDNNIQLREFMEQHELHPYMGITRTDLYVYFINGETIATAEPRDTTAIIYHINQIQ